MASWNDHEDECSCIACSDLGCSVADRYMTDAKALQLLILLHRYVYFAGDQPSDDITISALAGDLAMSMDVTSDQADFLRKEIEMAVS